MNNIKKNNSKFPRVLIINHSRINEFDAHGVSFRTWFGDWPKENLAQIYSGGESEEKVFCKYNFKLGTNERRYGNFFFRLKGSSFGKSSYVTALDDKNPKLNKISFLSLLKYRISRFLINIGLWEFIFKPKLSEELMKFIEKFKPQVIYCQGYNLTFTWLPVIVHQKFNIPICFQTGDDWPSYLYGKSPISFAVKPFIHRSILALLSASSVRLANGKLMAADYLERYNMTFEPLMMCDDIDRFREAAPHRITDKDIRSIIYTGGLGNGRWVSIIELCEAARLIEKKGIKIMVTAFASTIPKEGVNRLQDINNLQIRPAPSHEELPSYLKGADILYLPETFDPVLAKAFRLSISTKAHLYMMSEKPVLIYASPATGIVNYAKSDQWAHVVQEEDLNELSSAIYMLLTSPEYCQKSVKRGLEVVAKNHDKNKVRARLLEILDRIAVKV